MGLNIKKNDTVVVLSGKDKGSQGTVTKVLPKKGKVIVEGLNKAKKNERPNQNNQTGGIVDKEMPIDASYLMVVDSKSGKPTRIRRERESGKPSVRVSVKGGNKLD